MRFLGAALVCIAILYGLDTYFYDGRYFASLQREMATFISTGSHPASLRNVRNQGPQLITPIDASLFGETLFRTHGGGCAPPPALFRP